MTRFRSTSGRFATLAIVVGGCCVPLGLLSGCGNTAQDSGSAAVVNQKEVDAAQNGMKEFMASKKQGGKAARKP